MPNLWYSLMLFCDSSVGSSNLVCNLLMASSPKLNDVNSVTIKNVMDFVGDVIGLDFHQLIG